MIDPMLAIYLASAFIGSLVVMWNVALVYENVVGYNPASQFAFKTGVIIGGILIIWVPVINTVSLLYIAGYKFHAWLTK